MPVSPQTIEARAICARLAVFSSCEGNMQYLRKLIYEDSLVISSLIEPLEAIDPPVDYSIVQNLYKAAAAVGSVGAVGGNIQTWPLIQVEAPAAIMAAVALIEAVSEEPPETPPEPR